MFTDLYYQVFPWMFDFISRLVAIAQMTTDEFLGAITIGDIVYYVNLATGETSSFYFFGNVLTTPFTLFFEVLTLGVPFDLPIWITLLYACINGFLIIAIVKFLLELVL